MIKSVVFTSFCFIALIHCVHLDQQHPIEIEFEYEDGSVPTVTPAVSTDTVETTPMTKAAINQMSNVVNNDGSFKFSTSGSDGLLIEIEGSLKEVNGTKTLVIEGTYQFGEHSWWFSGDEGGFLLKDLPIGLSNKVVASLLGR